MVEHDSYAPINGNFEGKDVISIDQFNRSDVEEIIAEAELMQSHVEADGAIELLHRPKKLLAALFFQPSTRTFASFLAAAQRLEGGIIPIVGSDYSSMAKGESLEDTIRTMERYADVIAIRHNEVGSAARAADAAQIPVINAGDGPGEHPTQALLDTYTIKEKLGHLENLNVTMVGDLKNGRTVHSLARLLSLFGSNLTYISPDSLRMPEDVMSLVGGQGARQTEGYQLDPDVVTKSDVIYVTRVQKEYFDDPSSYEEVKGFYTITPETMEHAKQRMALMHPLPRDSRNYEIHPSVDADLRAAYFDQVEYGQYVRMAILAKVLGKSARDLAMPQRHRD